MKTPILTHSIVSAAIAALKPTIGQMVKTGQLRRGTMHFVFCDPRLRETVAPDSLESWIRSGGILHEETVRVENDATDATRYVEIARRKAYQTWLLGQASGDVAARRPYLLESGETVYAGSAIYEGLCAAVSGQQAPMDEALAGMLLSLVIGFCRLLMASETAPVREGFVVK